MLDLADIFGSQGPLRRALPGFTVRAQQRRMAQRVADALSARESLVVEAGTGTGKTFAYLVPALLCGGRVLISTGTRTLQDQLFSKDLPLVAAALGRPARVAVLKGRSNYLCRHRLARTQDQLALEGLEVASHTLARIERWAHITRTGDLAEVTGLSDSHALWPQVTSTRDNCLGVRCEALSRCHVVAARREALEADIVIVNHHLLLADLALKEDGFGDILGSADAVILDEAHQIADLATQFFGVSLPSRQIENVLKELGHELPAAQKEEAVLARTRDILGLVQEIYHDMLTLLPRRPGRTAWEEAPGGLDSAVRELAHALQALSTDIEALDEENLPKSANALKHAGARALEIAADLERIVGTDQSEGVRSIEVSARGFTLHLLPFDIAARFQSLVQARHCAWIFTSATLSVGEDFTHFTSRLGLQDAATLQIDSPFDYERQSLLYLPQNLPQPFAPEFTTAVILTAMPLIEVSGGGAFILFTSHRALAQGAALLRTRWGQDVPYRLYVQGEAPREQLLKEFREDGHGVLLGTASFWEGVDVKGEALRLVIIEKLPFASPEDPLVRARIDHIEHSGGNAFRDYQLPEAALTLKQGVGRLIRSEEDFGAVVICDRRLLEKPYGRVFRAALPAMSLTRELDEALRFLARHAPASHSRRICQSA